MKKIVLFCLLSIIICYSCSRWEAPKNELLNKGKLAGQLVSINSKRDTVLQTNKGAIIKIPKGTLVGAGEMVQLEIKEAYSVHDMLLAGLTTQSNGKLLSSGGMIYINAAGGGEVKITSAIKIAIPADNLDKGMQLFKGEISSSGSINWVDPQSLLPNPQIKALDTGKVIFNTMCASCHMIGKNSTGPDLAHVVKRYEQLFFKAVNRSADTVADRQRLEHARLLLYEYTRDNVGVKSRESSAYHRCLNKIYNGAAMNLFTSITDQALDNLYAYIQNESERRNLPVPDNGIMKCIDSCNIYLQLKGRLEEVKRQLESDSVNMAEVNNIDPTSTGSTLDQNSIVTPSPDPLPLLESVEPLSNKSLYYQFSIESFGWYNVDILLKEGPDNLKSELMIRVVGQYRERFNIYLIIPSAKVIAEGGPIKDQYGFTKDGTIYLPQGVKAFIMAVGEYEDEIIFGKKEFVTGTKQVFDMELIKVSKETFSREVKILSLPDINISVIDTKNADTLRTLIRELKTVEQLKPKTCDCDCFLAESPASPVALSAPK